MQGWLPPYRDNFIVDAAGIGPYMLYDGQPRGLATLDRSPGWIWRVAGVAASFGVVALIALAVAVTADFVRKRRSVEPERVFMAALIVTYLAPFVVTDHFERYLLFVLPFLFALWARSFARAEGPWARGGRSVALAGIALMIGMSAAATRDYFAWNRARRDLIAEAERLGATPATLDGGLEYNGFRRFGGSQGPGKSWWWVEDDAYVVAFSSLHGYDVIDVRRVPTWLPRSPAKIKLLRRKSAAPDIH
ncbi:MAG: hypothetical protein ABI812_07315 [Betaproteobacteria bacterium]